MKRSFFLLGAACALPAMLVPNMARGQEISHSTASLSVARYGASAVAVNGKLLVAGGAQGDPAYVKTRVDLHTPGSPMWSTAELSTARMYVPAASLGSKGYFGPDGRDSYPPQDIIDVYDDLTGTWSQMHLSSPRQEVAAAAAGTKVLFAGGRTLTGWADTVDIYDAATGSRTLAHLSKARSDIAAVTVGGTVLLAGGFSSFSPTTWESAIDIYCASTGQWTTASLPVPGAAMCALAVGDKAYFAGGGINFVPSNRVDVFDTTDGTWSLLHLPHLSGYMTGTVLGPYLLFAENSVTFNPTVDVYDTRCGNWSTVELSVGRAMMGVATAGDQAFFAGGYNPGVYSGRDTVDIFTIPEPTCAVLLLGAMLPVIRKRHRGRQALSPALPRGRRGRQRG
jgi:hypothetical protein